MLKPFPIANFRGFFGKTSPFDIDPNVMFDVNNVHLSDLNGVASKIKGYAKLRIAQTSLSGTPMDMYTVSLTLNANQLLAFTVTKIYKLDASDFTEIKTGLTGTNLNNFSYDVAIDDTSSPPDELVLATNGVDNIQKWDVAASPTAMADLGGSPVKARQLLWWNRRVFLGYTIEGGVDFPNRLRWSGIGDPEDWSSALSGFLDLDLNDGEIIIKLIPFRNFMAVLCSKSIVLITLIGGTSVVSALRFPTNFSCIAPNSAFNLESTLMYMSRNGLVAFDGSSYKLITADRWNLIDVDFSNFSTCNVGLVSELNQLYFAYKSVNASSLHDKILIFDYLKNEITFSDFSFAGFDEFEFGADIIWDEATWSWDSESRTWNEFGVITGQPILVGLDNNGDIQKLNLGGNKDGSAIGSSFESGWLFFGEPDRRKKIHKIFIHTSTQNHSITLKLFTEFNDTAVKTKTVSMVNASGVFNRTEVDVMLDFMALKFKIENNNSDEQFLIHSIVFLFEDTRAIT